MLLLSNNIHDYYFVSQGKTTIPGLDDGEELLVTDVSATTWTSRWSRFVESRLEKSILFRSYLHFIPEILFPRGRYFPRPLYTIRVEM